MAHHTSTTEVGAGKLGAEQQAFLDKQQYATRQITKYECVFGKGFMSAGGLDTTREYCAMLGDLPEGARVLDIGCGVGGSAFYFADTYGAEVTGIDLATNSVELAVRRSTARNEAARAECRGSCSFRVENILDVEFADETFDVIYSRDALLHITYADKPDLFAKIHRWLKPRGQLLLSDYAKGPASATELSPEFAAYVAKRGYYLLTPSEYAELCVGAGFDVDAVNCEDRSWQYCTLSRTEIDRVRLPGPARNSFVAQYSQAELDDLVHVYDDKVDMTVRGERSFVVVHARKSPSYAALRAAVCAECKQMAADGLVFGTDGNVSARVAPGSDLILIKPSGVDYDELTPDMIVLCTADGKVQPGEPRYKPSSEINLHTGLYRVRPDVGAVVHTHSIACSTLACCRLDLPCAHYSVNELSGTSPDNVIRCAPYHTYGTKELGDACQEYLGRRSAVLLANHGAVAVGGDLAEAAYNVRRLERECDLFWRCLQVPAAAAGAAPLSSSAVHVLGDDDMDAIRERNKTYGQVGEGEEGSGHGIQRHQGCCG